jgi:hypothetical protein
MDRWRFYTVYGHWLWAVFFVVSIVVAVAALLHGCSGNPPAQSAVKVTEYVLEALCSDDMTVKECRESLDARAKFLDGDAGVE